MNLTIPDTALATAVLGVGSALAWGVKVIVAKIDAFLTKLEASQERIEKAIDETRDRQSQASDYSKIQRALARKNAFVCETCGGWDGPHDLAPKGAKFCTCSDPPPHHEKG